MTLDMTAERVIIAHMERALNAACLEMEDVHRLKQSSVKFDGTTYRVCACYSQSIFCDLQFFWNQQHEIQVRYLDAKLRLGVYSRHNRLTLVRGFLEEERKPCTHLNMHELAA